MEDAIGRESGFSVVIPTIWKCPENLLELTRRLGELDKCGQILIIDNCGAEDSFDGLRDELRCFGAVVVRLPYNVLVNAAWNLGICLARCDRFLLINDDVQIYETCLSDLLDVLDEQPDCGLVGFATESVTQQPIAMNQPGAVMYQKVPELKTNYGCCMAGRTDEYVVIPRTLRLFAGDNWLFYASRSVGRSNYAITNKQIQHLLSVSSREFPDFAQSDWDEFQRLWQLRVGTSR